MAEDENRCRKMEHKLNLNTATLRKMGQGGMCGIFTAGHEFHTASALCLLIETEKHALFNIIIIEQQK
jgi:hypothetical protein